MPNQITAKINLTELDNNTTTDINGLNDSCIFNAIKQCYLQNKKQCKIGHINVNSIRHKFEPFREILQEHFWMS